MESPVATALCAVSSVSLNHRHDAPQGRGYNIQETASGSDNLHSCMLKNGSRLWLILFVSFIDAICALP
jgi:hypothetical protein